MAKSQLLQTFNSPQILYNADGNRRRSASGGNQKRHAFGVRLTVWLGRCIGLAQRLAPNCYSVRKGARVASLDVDCRRDKAFTLILWSCVVTSYLTLLGKR